jgi:predicted signal transduction protein with EAL and GGDEF domain
MTRPDAVYAAIESDDDTPGIEDRLCLDVDSGGRILAARAPRTGTPTWMGSAVVGLDASNLFVGDDALAARALFHRATTRPETGPLLLRMQSGPDADVVVRVTATPSAEGARVRIRDCDADDLQELCARADERARRDPLTGLPKLRSMLERARNALAATPPVLVLVDLDRIHELLAALGPCGSDGALVEIGDRLVATVGDLGVVGVSGLRFAILLAPPPVPEMMSNLVAQVHAAIAAPMSTRSDAIELSACLGLAYTTDLDALVVDAEVALAQAKALAPGSDAIFHPAFRHRARHEATLRTDLARAVVGDELRLDYQPIVELETAVIVGYEALVRWEHPIRGLLAPREFLGIAQHSGAGAAIDDWVLIEACGEAGGWSRTGPDATICVNVAPQRFAAPGFVDRITGALDSTGLDPSRLLLEITEWSVLVDVDAARYTLAGLRSLGVRVALDDYGTGYSSLANVAALEVDELKIDISFVAGLGSDRARTAIVRAIVGLGEALDITVVAEGVEHADQAFALRALGCEYAQGFHFGRPTPTPALVSTARARTS